MPTETGHEVPSSRSIASILALAALAAAFCFVASPANAQGDNERVGLLNRLFSPFKQEAERPQPKAVIIKPRKKKAPRARSENTEPPQVAVITKRPDAHVVLVIGDFLAGGLAEGLTTAFTQNPNVRIVDRSNGSSGFVRKDFYDWSANIDRLILEEKPSAIVVMIGANDRQQMLVDGVRETVRSGNWNREYADRATKLGSAIAAHKVPFVWIGMPPFKSSKMMLDMIAFNDVYRAAASATGGEFIDIWDGFVDENGAYVSNGPDLNGQPARLRAEDGINLARPGKRKIAFYAEKPLYKLLGEDPAAAAAAQANALATRPAYRIFGPFGPSEPQPPVVLDMLVNPNEVGRIDPARPVALRTPGLDGGEELLGAVAEPLREARTAAERLIIDGLAPKPPAGRADQFAGPQLTFAAAATQQIDIDTTLNKKAAPSGPLLTAVDTAAMRIVRSNVLVEPQPRVPPRLPPEIRPDRLEEISPAQAAPDAAPPEPRSATPGTIGKGPTPDFAKGDPLDLSPARAAPREAYKRPRSIGPEPNRAPTAVPPPVEDIFAPAEAGPGIPSASADESPDEPVADAPPAPAKAPAPSTVPGVARDAAPARSAPGHAAPVPVAELPATKAAPSELLPAAEAPELIAPAEPVEPATGIAAAKAVPATGADDMESSAPMRLAPASDAVGATSAPARGAPSEAADEAPPAPVAPAPPTDLLERASTPPARRTDRRAVLPSTTVGPETDVASVSPTPAVDNVAVTRP